MASVAYPKQKNCFAAQINTVFKNEDWQVDVSKKIISMNQKRFINIVLIIVAIIIGTTMGYMAFSQKSPAPTPILSPTPAAGSKEKIVSLGQQFTLKIGQVAKVTNTGLEIEITAFYNNPCPAGMECLWSGVGIGFEYRLNGQAQKGIDLAQAFGYQTTIVKTDHETYANLIVEKMK